LAQVEIGRRALANRPLFEDVVRFKSVFFRSAGANDDECVTGGLRLVPVLEPVVAGLESDYREMIDAGMFSESPPDFADILARRDELALVINSPAS
jgi:hypothetical protein